jgi:hypothetical protein
VKITKVLGTDGLYQYLEKYDIPLDAQYDDLLGKSVTLFVEFPARRVTDPLPNKATLSGRGRGSLLPRTSGTSQTKQLTSWTNSCVTIIKSDSPLARLRVIRTLVCILYPPSKPAVCNLSVSEPVRNAAIMDGNSSDGSGV